MQIVCFRYNFHLYISCEICEEINAFILFIDADYLQICMNKIILGNFLTSCCYCTFLLWKVGVCCLHACMALKACRLVYSLVITLSSVNDSLKIADQYFMSLSLTDKQDIKLLSSVKEFKILHSYLIKYLRFKNVVLNLSLHCNHIAICNDCTPF